MNWHIRKWKPEDVEQLVELTFQWGYETTREKIENHLKRIAETDNAEVFVAEAEGKAVGRVFVMEHITLGSDHFAEVHDLVVDEKFRKLGIGKALIEEAKKWSKEKGFGFLRLRTNLKREEANIFYPAIGFAPEKQQQVYTIRL